ncbi:MAG TPA: c-type cytochrome [Gemmataceae bacterium]|nr:c-type cytochrome [Gemmataceae bacterium]
MTFPVRRAALFVWAAGLLTAAPAAAHPIVPGFERFHGRPDSDAAAGGLLLMSELNCTSCHETDAAKKQAPVLDGVGTRVRASHLRKFLADPHAVKPGTTMPGLFANDPGREAKVEALVHFLASTGPAKHGRPDVKAVLRGRDTFAKVGCAACHGPRDVAGEPTKATFTFAVPLGDLKGKYTLLGLTAFLGNPLQTRPAGRMPQLLKANEAADVANYLLQGTKDNLPAGKGTTKYAYYEGSWDKLPDFAKLKPKATGAGIAFEVGVAKDNNNYALRFEGVLRAEAAGAYTFTLTSDDGSRLAIDGRTVVDNDGVHPATSKTATTELTKGVHQIVVDFLQGGGEAQLDVEIEGRGLGRQPLATLVAATEADLDRQVEPALVKDEDALTVDPALVEKGKGLFASVGCANCHQMTVAKTAVAPTLKAPAMKASGGCLSESPGKRVPQYHLSAAQKKALAAAAAKPQAAKVDMGHTLLTFNCYACHTRDRIGGPTEATNALFATTTPEMGDEGRVPPPLDGVGAKLNPEYVKQILDKGADDRPYMHTRMPGFGAANVAHLVEAFVGRDKLPAVAPVKFAETESKVKAAGRHMVGAQAFGCIKCHTFAGQKAEGVQGIDMTLMPKRLKREWFHAYCVDPQKIRPGTRMPTAWPGGQSVLPTILDGAASTQIEAIWVYLNAKDAAIPPGMGKKFLPLVPAGEAIIYRNFIQGAGPRAIGVGYPEKLNLAFDANDLRLALIWKGGFIDAARHWTDRGSGFEGPLGDDVLALAGGPTFAVLGEPDTEWPKSAKDAGQRFLGYVLAKDERPTFRYAVGGATVEDFPNPSGKVHAHYVRTLTVSADRAVDGLYFRAAVGSKIARSADGWYQVDGWKVKVAGGSPTVRQSGGKSELVVPIKDGKAKIVQEIAW